jgi:hypothetical protein
LASVYIASVKFPCLNKIDHTVHNDRDKKNELLSLSLQYYGMSFAALWLMFSRLVLNF